MASVVTHGQSLEEAVALLYLTCISSRCPLFVQHTTWRSESPSCHWVSYGAELACYREVSFWWTFDTFIVSVLALSIVEALAAEFFSFRVIPPSQFHRFQSHPPSQFHRKQTFTIWTLLLLDITVQTALGFSYTAFLQVFLTIMIDQVLWITPFEGFKAIILSQFSNWQIIMDIYRSIASLVLLYWRSKGAIYSVEITAL